MNRSVRYPVCSPDNLVLSWGQLRCSEHTLLFRALAFLLWFAVKVSTDFLNHLFLFCDHGYNPQDVEMMYWKWLIVRLSVGRPQLLTTWESGEHVIDSVKLSLSVNKMDRQWSGSDSVLWDRIVLVCRKLTATFTLYTVMTKRTLGKSCYDLFI